MTDILTKGVTHAPSVYGVDISDPNQFTVAGVFRAPTVKGAYVFDETVVVPDIVARLYELPDLQNPVTTNADGGELARSFSRRWVETLNDPGSGELSFANDDPDLELIHKNSVIGFEYKGWRAFDIVCDTKHKVALAEGEEVAEGVTWSGKGLARMLDWGEVYPSLGILRVPIEENRAYNWTSPVYNDSAWPGALVLGSLGALAFPSTLWGSGGTLDENFPDASASVIAAPGDSVASAAEGDRYIRQRFNVPESSGYLFFYLADDVVEVYIDGAKFTGTNPENWQSIGNTQSTTVELDAGEHIITARLTNIRWGSGGNPTGFVWSLIKPNPPAFTIIAHSDGSAKVLRSDTPPGMSLGVVLLSCLFEFMIRGGLPDLQWSFNGVTDSNGNTWPIVADAATRVGTKIGVFFRELCDTYIDLRWRAGGMVLDAYIKDTLGTARTVDFHAPTDPDDPASGNLLHLEQDQDSTEQANALLLRADYGWDETVRSPGPYDYGRIENLFGVGAQSSPAEVARISDGQLDIYADPVEQITGVVRAAVADEDYKLGYDIGDTIAGIPDIDGTVVAQRVVSVAVTEDNSTGVASTVPSFKGIVYTAPERFAIDVAKMTPGTAGGTSRVAQPVTPPGKIVGKPLKRGGWDEFIQGSDPWHWWRLAEATAAADLLVAKDRMNRVDARYRQANADGTPPLPELFSDVDYGFWSGSDPGEFPYLVTGRPGLVSQNPNKAARFKEASAWVETPGAELEDDDGRYVLGDYPWFTAWSALCIFQVDEWPADGTGVLDFLLMRYPAANDVWRVFAYDYPDSLTLAASSVNEPFVDAFPNEITLGERHLLVVSQEVTLDGFDIAATRWRGDWNPSTIYQPGDIVTTVVTDGANYANPSAGNIYIATEQNSGADPDTVGEPPWATQSVLSATIHVYLDNVEQFTLDGYASPSQSAIFRAFTTIDAQNGIPFADMDVTGDEVVVWSRTLTADERATALDLSGV